MAKKSAKKALEQFKMQAANEVGVTLNNNGYNGDITSRQAGSIGGQMVKITRPVRTFKFYRTSRISRKHKTLINFQFVIIAG